MKLRLCAMHGCGPGESQAVMQKWSGLFFACVILVLAFPYMARAYKEPALDYAPQYSGAAPDIYINEIKLILDVPPALRGGRVFVPVTQSAAWAFDADAVYAQTAGGLQLTLSMPGAQAVFTEGLARYSFGGTVRMMADAPLVMDGVLAVPVQPLFEALGGAVTFTEDAVIVDMPLPSAAVQEIPDSMFIREPGEMPPRATGTEEIPFEESAFQYTYENTIEFENNAISGNETLSNLQRKTDYYERINLRMTASLESGWVMNSTLRASATTDEDLKQGEVDRFVAVFQKEQTSWTVYDLYPRLTRYALKNYQMQGVQFSKRLGAAGVTAVWGKTPRELRESEYIRYVRGLHFNGPISDSTQWGLGYVAVRDTGDLQPTDRLDNRVFTMTGDYKKNDLAVQGEMAMSMTRVFHEQWNRGKARWINAQWRSGDRATSLNMSYERTGSQFESETAFFTAGRRELSMLLNHRLNKRTLFGGGWKNVILLGETTWYSPVQLALSPFAARPKLRMTLKRNYEKTRGRAGTRVTDRRALSLDDRFGAARVRWDFERRAQKDVLGSRSWRTSRRYRFDTPLTDRLNSQFQVRQERRTTGSSPMNRFVQARFVYELAEWDELTLTLERYYNGTPYNRFNNNLQYRRLDVLNDREISIEIGTINYPQHNENTLRIKYSFYR